MPPKAAVSVAVCARRMPRPAYAIRASIRTCRPQPRGALPRDRRATAGRVGKGRDEGSGGALRAGWLACAPIGQLAGSIALLRGARAADRAPAPARWIHAPGGDGHRAGSGRKQCVPGENRTVWSSSCGARRLALRALASAHTSLRCTSSARPRAGKARRRVAPGPWAWVMCAL